MIILLGVLKFLKEKIEFIDVEEGDFIVLFCNFSKGFLFLYIYWMNIGK